MKYKTPVMNELNIILNGNIVKGFQGETIYDLATRQGIEIPTLCHDPRIEPYTSCYVCVVEVEGLRGLQPSCSTKITDGMKIETHNARVKKARKTALDLLLSNHYADCVAPCKETCPAGVDVQGYISFIEKGMYHEAVELIKETNPLPAICGRVCVRPCEVACRRNLLDEGHGVGIDYLKRFAADRDLESPDKWKPSVKTPTGKKVCVIGAGPGGLSAAFFLRKEGHEVDIFEASPSPGGWLRYGIPEYRLPNDLLQKEVDNITELGVKIYYNTRLGKDLSFKNIREKYDASILAIGSQLGTSVGCEGDDAINVFSGVDFLKEMEMTGKPFDFTGKKVAIIGGGNTAMDCCRTALRCGAEKSIIIYRRTEKEMPANPIEIHESKLEGVEYLLLTAPSTINKDAEGKVKSITCLKMALGEPDASGRRRPVPVEGSEFDIEIDYILAAIGQKTHIDFLEDMNQHAGRGELKPTRWGDVDTDPKTLQTGIPGVFAAGDGVTGPATLIQAIAQARIASLSCHQYLSGEDLHEKPFEFVSKRDNFKTQVNKDYVGFYRQQLREEMPTLEPSSRKNFKEVELGYTDEQIAYHEAQRCLECGCNEYYICDLKRFATEYHAEQKRLSGEFKEYHIDFRHPFIEIDNNKCILCSRCIRICREVVGANALGLVNRGFETFVAPSMGNSLQETTCESCGMCISACPTGAMTENYQFKPGPVKLTSGETVCNYCSVGCSITLNHKNGYVMKVTGAEGPVNSFGNLCRYPKFGYPYLNDVRRIMKPLLKVNGSFTEISFEKAFAVITEKIKSVAADENAFFGGARLTNEELYLVQKIARKGAKTNNAASFHYMGRGKGYLNNASFNTHFDQIKGASRLYLVGSEINRDNAVAGFMIQDAHTRYKLPMTLVTVMKDSPVQKKADAVIKVDSYYYFIKAVNHHLLAHKLYNQLYIQDHCQGFEDYKSAVLKESFTGLAGNSGLKPEQIVAFAEDFNNQMNAVLVCSEKEVDSATSREIFNLVMLTGKLGKTSNGLISLKEKNNSQGVFDMGVCPTVAVGGQSILDTEVRARISGKWGTDPLPGTAPESLSGMFFHKKLRNIFIFGEDPLGCAKEKGKIHDVLTATDFLMVQDYFMTATAKEADLILPASFPAESGGSFTNTQKVFQEFQPALPSRLEHHSWQQLSALLQLLSGDHMDSREEVMMEVFSLLPEKAVETRMFSFTQGPGPERLFNHGCDSVQMRFDMEFKEKLGKYDY